MAFGIDVDQYLGSGELFAQVFFDPLDDRGDRAIVIVGGRST